MAFSVGATNLPMPVIDGITKEYTPQGVSMRTAAGGYRAQVIATKYRVTVQWRHLTSAERTTALNVYTGILSTSATLVLPDGVTFTTLAEFNTWKETTLYAISGTVHDVSFVFVEV